MTAMGSEVATAGRADGRKPTQIRTLVCEQGVLQRADGSARWTQGGTVVLCSVFGPRMTLSRKEDPERAVVQVVWRPRACENGARERQLEALVQSTIEGAVLASLHPRTEVQVVIQVLEDDGAVVAAGINAAAAALTHAGVPMACMLSAITCSVLPGGLLLLDPTASEQQEAAATACMAFASRGSLLGNGGTAAAAAAGEAAAEAAGTAGSDAAAAAAAASPKQRCSEGVLSALCEGPLQADEYLKLVGIARAGCERVAAFQRRVLERAYAAPGG